MIISIGNSPFNTQKVDIFMHPIRYDLDVKKYFTYEPLSEESILALIVKEITYDKLSLDLKDYFDDLDEGYLFSESNFDEFELEEIVSSLEENNTLILGNDILTHPSHNNILKLAFILKKYSNFDVNLFIEDENLEEIAELDTFDGAVIYFDDRECEDLIASSQFLIANRKKDSQIVNINNKFNKKIVIDEKLKGVFGIVCEKAEGYSFQKVIIS
jgi:hypothetical protein